MSDGTALYNEIDPYAAAWLSNLASEGRIAPGRVDARSIVDLRPSDLDGCGQFHAFAGIGGWSLAMRLAGVPDDFPVWTGSCPCQPFSVAGQQRGFADDRHLWPAWFRLIRECRPAIVFGEQVEAAVRLGWLNAVFADLEGEDYACGAAVLGAHSVGAPHIRQRLWFVAYASDIGRLGRRRGMASHGRATSRIEPERLRDAHELAHAGRERCDGQHARLWEPDKAGWYSADRVEATGGREADFWSDAIWLPCQDGKSRPTQPGLQPLAHGVSGRVGKLRAAGNAIVPQVAAAFIAASLAALREVERLADRQNESMEK